jgi:hypothetical protein
MAIARLIAARSSSSSGPDDAHHRTGNAGGALPMTIRRWVSFDASPDGNREAAILQHHVLVADG